MDSYSFFLTEIKREEEGGEGNQGEGWEPPHKKRRASDEDEAPKKQALRAHLALQLTHHSGKVTNKTLNVRSSLLIISHS